MYLQAYINPFPPDPGRTEKINLNFYFHTLWCLKRFYQVLKGLHKTFGGTTRGHSNSTFVVQSGRVLKKRTKTNRGRGSSSLSVRPLCEKNCLIFSQQVEFFLISCLAVAKCFVLFCFCFFLSLVQHIKLFQYQKGVDIFFFI